MDIKDYDIKFLRRKLGLVQQQPVLFADTISNNLQLGFEEVPKERMKQALLEANAEFVYQTSKGVDEFVGSQGEQLSGGQKQRIAIARTLLRDPATFLFDEATSALDRKTEFEIQNTLDGIAGQHTSISIAHRLNTIKNCDKILVMKDGRLIESGMHSQLIEIPDGLYNKLAMMQFERDTAKQERPAEMFAQRTESNIFGSDFMDSDVRREYKKESIPKFSMWKYIGKEKPGIVLGMLASIVQGAVFPLFGFCFGFVLESLAKLTVLAGREQTTYEGQTIRLSDVIKELDLYVIYFALLGVCSFVFISIQQGLFNWVGESFTDKLRTNYFRRMLYQDMQYHDLPENSPGSISSRLSKDCKTINVLVSSYLGSIIQSICSFFIGLGIAIGYNWRLTLVSLALSPILFLGGLVNKRVSGPQVKNSGKSGQEDKNFNLLTDTFNNMKLVRSLTAEEHLARKFEDQIKLKSKKESRKALFDSVVFAFSQMGIFLVYGTVFYVGAIFMRDYNVTTRQFMISIFCIIFGAMGAGMATQHLSTLGDAKKAVAKVKTDFEAPTFIESDPQNPQRTVNKVGSRVPRDVRKIEFRDVFFSFPSRPTPVLRGVNLELNQGQSVALVGNSGSGKSTVMQLLLHFYDVNRGQILIDGVDIKEFELKALRSLYANVR